MPRFVSWLATAVAAAFLVVATASYAPGVVADLALAISIGTLIVSAGVAVAYRSDVASVIVGFLAAAISVWTIVASQIFSDPTVQSLALASGLAIGALSIVGITAHELSHQLAASSGNERSTERESRLAAAA